MIFKRRPKYPELQLTQRQISAMAAAPKRKAKKLQAKPPLLAELIEVEEIDLDAVIDKRKDMVAQSERYMRDQQAKFWREARAEFFAAPLETQLKIAIHWCYMTQRHMPATNGCFIYVVRQYTKPWRPADQRNPKVAARQAWIDALKQAKRYCKAV